MIRSMNTERKHLLYSFLIPFIMALVTLLPFIIADKGFFFYYGDYNAQTIPFHETCIKAIQNGETGWNWYTDMGVNFVGTYPHYLASPFFWITVLFPAEFSKYLLGPILALKIGFSGLTAFVYIRRFVSKPQSAVLGGILYAFSGYSVYNIVFFMFHDVLCFFPLLLAALEEAVVNKRKGIFAAAVAVNAVLNAFFFFQECIFLVLYFLCRLAASKEFRIRVSDFFSLAFESITGVLIAGVLLMPAMYYVLFNDRISDVLTGNPFLFYKQSQYYGNILRSIFFVTDVANENILFPNIQYNWNSSAMYIPLFSMAGVIAFFSGTKKHWAKILLSVLLVIAFVPGLNAVFTLFNETYYARWYYMPSLICSMVTVYTLENERKFNWKLGIGLNALVVALMSALLIFYPTDRSYTAETVTGETKYIEAIMPKFMAEPMTRVYLYSGVTLLITVILYVFFRFRRKFTSEVFVRSLTVCTVICSVLLAQGAILYGRPINGYTADTYVEFMSDDVRINDDSTYRVDVMIPCHSYNMNMIWDLYSSFSFQSTVPSGTTGIFRLFSGTDRFASSDYPYEHYAARALLGTKYYIVHEDAIVDDSEAGGMVFVDAADTSADSITRDENDQVTFPGATLIEERDDGYMIFKLDCAVPMGYSYDTCVPYDVAFTSVVKIDGKDYRGADRLAMNSAVLTEDQIEKYSDILTPLPETEFVSEKWTDERVMEDAAARNAAGVKAFSFGKNSFHAETAYAEDELVVFSVPYDIGWSAVIDGTPVETDKVNGGFIAVRVPAGEHSIDFSYETPGLKLGVIITAAGLLLLGGWIVLWYVVLKRGVQKPAHINTGIFAHDTYIASASGDDTSRR
ncbi:MAG: YfhO family protein [Oscillospiraceae bacterium]|nr:YfhO family protein [Oscillospiraceae bacterium]